ncbi:MAG: glycosyltransferase [Bacilli bacterium]|nr:glycosyltransferase [Bacilli bacterium]
MKTIFVFDTILLKDSHNDYYAQTLTYDFFKERYLNICDEIIVTTRYKKISNFTNQNKGYKKTNGKKISVKPIMSYSDIPDIIKKHKRIVKEMDEIVKNSDNLIIRLPSVLGLIACKSAIKYNKKYIIEMVACAWDGYMNHARFGGKLIAPIMYIKTKSAIKKAPNVIYVTNKFLQKRYPNKNNNIGCTDTLIIDKNEKYEKNRIKQLDKCNIKKMNIVTVASVQLKYKGQEYVMKAIKELKNEGYNLNYYLIGGGDNNRLIKFVDKYDLKDNVHFLGSKSHNEVFELLGKMHLYIQPSLQEGLPRAVVEAMSLGLPIIGSNAGGIPEIIEEKCIFKKKNVKQLKNRVINLKNQDLIDQSIRNFYYSKQFTPKKIDRIRKEFYSNVFKGSE